MPDSEECRNAGNKNNQIIYSKQPCSWGLPNRDTSILSILTVCDSMFTEDFMSNKKVVEKVLGKYMYKNRFISQFLKYR